MPILSLQAAQQLARLALCGSMSHVETARRSGKITLREHIATLTITGFPRQPNMALSAAPMVRDMVKCGTSPAKSYL
jgi:hypothetical protein